jgi:hypothetical protein
VLRAGLVSDHLRAISPQGLSEDDFRAALEQAGVSEVRLEVVEPTLEDVFLALAN